jgi:type I restriction enzyme S subunit
MITKEVPLKNLLTDIRNGIDLEQFDSPINDSMIPISRIETIWNGTIDFDRVKYVNITEKDRQRYQLKIGDILFSHINSPEHIGKTAILEVHKPLVHGINLLLLRINAEKCFPKYLSYYLKTNQVRTNFRVRCKKAVNQASLNQEDITSITIPLPTPDEQKRIAAILDKAERLRRQRSFAKTLSDSFLQSIFIKMFGDPVSNPMNFGTSKLKNVLEFPPQNGLYVPSELYADTKGKSGTEMVHMSDLFYDVVERGSLKRVMIDEKEIKKYQLDHDDLLLARRSLNYEGAAKPCRVPESNEPLVFESSMIRLRAAKTKLLPVYFFYYLSNERARKAHVLKYITRSTISGINQDNLNQIEVILPPLPLQEKFATIVQKFERVRRQQREATRQAEHLFQTLLHRAFQGEL